MSSGSSHWSHVSGNHWFLPFQSSWERCSFGSAFSSHSCWRPGSRGGRRLDCLGRSEALSCSLFVSFEWNYWLNLAHLLSLFGSLLGLDSVLNDIDDPLTANQEWLIGRLLPLRQKFQQLTLDLVISPAHRSSSKLTLGFKT